jgi:ABC-2 type transport system ATP-binding protein
MSVGSPHIRSANLSFSRSAQSVFSDFTVELTEFPLVLLGPNGAGKSTLFGLIAGALSPRRGEVVVAGESQEWSKVRDLRRHVGLVPQQSLGLRGLSVRDVVVYSGWLKGMSKSAALDASHAALDRVGLRALSETPSTRISGGESRRMTIASTLVSAPDVLLFDEPTTGLDPAQRATVMELIREIGSTKPTIVSTHEVDDLDDHYTNLAVLNHGEIAFHGSVRSFLEFGSAGLTNRMRAEDAYRTVLQRHEAQ